MSKTTEAVIQSVSGAPEKDFFVSMLTRDIELHDAVLDLLDNCVDGALRSRPAPAAEKDSLEGYWAKITFNSDRFVIEDNCGGIPWDLAENYAFKMGKAADYKRPIGTIGLVGIGMKRAIFKMGRQCLVHSHHKNDTFLVEILPDWFSNDSWNFGASREKPLQSANGTILEITELTEGARLAFGPSSDFELKFRQIVAQSYSYLIAKGFKVWINGKVVPRKPLTIYFEMGGTSKRNNLIQPFIYEAVLKGVKVFMAAGYRAPLKTDEELSADAEGQFRAEESGWTIVCNDRVVVNNDRTVLSGWGFSGVPSFHNQFSSIAGVVEFRCDDTSKLPLTTTKRGIDAGKEIYVLVRQKMQEATKHFTQNTNRWKGHEAELRGKFKKAEALDLPELRKRAKVLPLRAVPGHGEQVQYRPVLPQKTQIITDARISFVRLKVDVAKVSEFLFGEERAPSAVGEECFDRVLKKLKQ